MAQKTITTLVDDLDGLPIEDGKGETIKFALDGTNYEIDLTDDNAQKLRDALKPFVSSARKSSRFSAPQAARSTSNKQDLAGAREWLRSQGHQVSDRGRIPGNLLDLYRSK
jgi:hypothetical protein